MNWKQINRIFTLLACHEEGPYPGLCVLFNVMSDDSPSIHGWPLLSHPYWSEVLSRWVSKVVGQWEGHEMRSVVDTDARSRPWHLYNTYLLAWHLCLRALSLHFLLWKVLFFTARATHRTLSSHVGVKPRPQTSASHVNAVQQEEVIPLTRQAPRSATIPTKDDSLIFDTWHLTLDIWY